MIRTLADFKRMSIPHRFVALLHYLIVHKWLLVKEGRDLGVSWWAIIVHDLDKLLPDYLWYWVIRCDAETCNRIHHQRASHHWEYWTKYARPYRADPLMTAASPKDGVGFPIKGQWYIYEVLPKREMLADWQASHRANGGTNLRAWYVENKPRMILAKPTEMYLDRMLAA